MKRALLSPLFCAFVMIGHAQTKWTAYEFPKGSSYYNYCINQTAGSTSDAAHYCDSVCTFRIGPDLASDICGNNFSIVGDVDYCFYSNPSDPLYDGCIRTNGWPQAASFAPAFTISLMSSDYVTQFDNNGVPFQFDELGYVIQYDSIIVRYKTDGVPSLRLNAAAFTPESFIIDMNLNTDGTWSHVTFDLSSMSCISPTMTSFWFNPYGSSDLNSNFDIDAVYAYGHECLSTGIIGSDEESSAVLQLQDGVQITTKNPVEVFIHDPSGRAVFHKNKWNGTGFIPMDSGVYVVRAGNTVKKVVFQ